MPKTEHQQAHTAFYSANRNERLEADLWIVEEHTFRAYKIPDKLFIRFIAPSEVSYASTRDDYPMNPKT